MPTFTPKIYTFFLVILFVKQRHLVQEHCQPIVIPHYLTELRTENWALCPPLSKGKGRPDLHCGLYVQRLAWHRKCKETDFWQAAVSAERPVSISNTFSCQGTRNSPSMSQSLRVLRNQRSQARATPQWRHQGPPSFDLSSLPLLASWSASYACLFLYRQTSNPHFSAETYWKGRGKGREANGLSPG